MLELKICIPLVFFLGDQQSFLSAGHYKCLDPGRDRISNKIVFCLICKKKYNKTQILMLKIYCKMKNIFYLYIVKCPPNSWFIFCSSYNWILKSSNYHQLYLQYFFQTYNLNWRNYNIHKSLFQNLIFEILNQKLHKNIIHIFFK